ncbi:4990_t:CDS:2, partial [Gigaspora margarita]
PTQPQQATQPETTPQRTQPQQTPQPETIQQPQPQSTQPESPTQPPQQSSIQQQSTAQQPNTQPTQPPQQPTQSTAQQPDTQPNTTPAAPQLTTQPSTQAGTQQSTPQQPIVKLRGGKIITSEDHNSHAQTIVPPDVDSKTITKFTTTVFIETVTQVYPGYTTTITTTNENGELTTYSTYYPPSTIIVLQTVTGVVPLGYEITDQNGANSLGDYGLFNRRNDGLVSVALSLWIVMWRMAYG